MDPRFLAHNTHLLDPKRFNESDPQLRLLQQQPYVHIPALLQQLPATIPGIYTLGGGRQIGKTTLLKQWMAKLLTDGTPPTAIAFFSGELIDDHHTLLRLLETQLGTMPTTALRYIIVDEVTYIRDWDKAIKYAADAGLLEQVILVITGSDLILMQEARIRFPGRRGKADIVNFHLYPLSFREAVNLTVGTQEIEIDELFEAFQRYLLHGGYLTAINDLALHNRILPATLATYSDWVRGDMVKRGKQEHHLQEILTGIIKRYNSQISWNALAQDLSIDHPATVADYVNLLESMDVLFIQSALLEDKLTAAPKKARKVIFADPFIFHAVKAWLEPVDNPYEKQIQPLINDSQWCANLVEACVTTHYRRFYSTYYIKAEGEVDIAYIDQKRFWPIEIKWTNQLRAKDLKQVAKYPNSKILTKTKQPGTINGIKTEPLPLALWRLFV